jgi:hypothetical protein
MGDSVQRSANACPAFTNRCISAGTPGNAQRGIVDEEFSNRICRIVLRLQQERRRRSAADPNIWIEREVLFGDRPMPRIESHGAGVTD